MFIRPPALEHREFDGGREAELADVDAVERRERGLAGGDEVVIPLVKGLAEPDDLLQTEDLDLQQLLVGLAAEGT